MQNSNYFSPLKARCVLSVVLVAGLFSLFLTGCGIQQFAAGPSPSTYAVGNISGKAFGGNAPIGGATVNLYATAVNTSISNGMYVGTATLLGTTTTLTDGSGGFSFGTVTACTANTQVYITLSSGNTGGGANTNEVLGTMLGPCGSVAPFSVVNEATTVAMAYAMSSFISMSGTTVNITAPANNSSVAATNVVSTGTVSKASGLAHAYANFLNLVDVPSGTALAAPITNSSAIAPQAVINTLASILQFCVNSTGGTTGTTNCGKLFNLAPAVGGTLPTNTFQAALNLARNPWVSAANVTSLFNLLSGIGASAVYSPTLTAQPKDWTLAIQYPVPANPYSGTNAFPFTLALDADDNVYVTSPENDPWLATASTQTTTTSISACLYGWASNGTFLPTIVPYTGTGGTPGVPGTGTAGSSTWFCSSSAAGTTQTDYLLTNIAADNVGNIWIHNFGSGSTVIASSLDFVVKANNSGSFVAQYTPPYQGSSTTNYQNVGLIVDKFNNVWFNALSSAGNLPNIIGIAAGSTGSTFSALTIGTSTTGPNFAAAGRGLAFDKLGNFFGASYGGSSGNAGTLALGGTAFFLPIAGTQTASGPYGNTSSTEYKKAIGGGSTSSGTSNNAPWGVAVDSANTAWFTAGGAPGQTETSAVNGLFKCVPSGGPPITSATCTTVNSSNFNAPKFLEVDGGSLIWVADTKGIVAYGSGFSTPAFLSPSGGFQPCIVGSGTTCTYPDFNASIKGIAVDSTGSVWFTTPDLTTTTTNANSLVQLIGTGSATWPLLAVQKPGAMPQ